MKIDTSGSMPPEYEYLNPMLFKARDHVFAIHAEIEKLENNPVNEKRIAFLQEEMANVINGLKNDFELQTWEDGPERSEEIAGIVDRHLSKEAYILAQKEFDTKDNTYSQSNYWADKFHENRTKAKAYYQSLDDAKSGSGKHSARSYESYDFESYTGELGQQMPDIDDSFDELEME